MDRSKAAGESGWQTDGSRPNSGGNRMSVSDAADPEPDPPADHPTRPCEFGQTEALPSPLTECRRTQQLEFGGGS